MTTANARFAFSAIGTAWEILTDEPLDQDVREAVLTRVDRFDRTYSRFRGDSLVAAIAAAPAGGEFVFPPGGVALFDLYDRLHAATDGAVDPLVGGDLERLGYDARYTLRALPVGGRQPPSLGWRSPPCGRPRTGLPTRFPSSASSSTPPRPSGTPSDQSQGGVDYRDGTYTAKAGRAAGRPRSMSRSPWTTT